MGNLEKRELDQIAVDLEKQGITFEPLRQELLDHLICDIESHMQNGKSFNEAKSLVMKNIPQNHFKNIQQETMEILNRKINPVRIFGTISLALLFFATLFKILHLAGAGVLLLTFLVSASITLLFGSARSIHVYRESRGRGVIFLVTLPVIAFIVALCFRVLQLPGAEAIMNFSVISICIIFPLLSIYFFISKQRLRDFLIIRLISENQKLLEKISLILIGFGLLFNYSSILVGTTSYSGIIFFIFAIILIGMYIYSLTWSYYVELDSNKGYKGMSLLVLSSLAFIMFMLPVMGNTINSVMRQYFAYLAMVFFMLIVFFYYWKESESQNKSVLSLLSLVLLFYPVLRLGTKLEWFSSGAIGTLTTNPVFISGFLIFLLLLLVVYRKERLFKALIILTIAAHMIPNL